MIWVVGVVVILVIGAAALAAAGHGDGLAEEYGDRPDVAVPEGPLAADDVRAVRFTTAVRGYRMDEVDALLERLAAQLEGADTPEDDRDSDDA